MFLFSSVVVVVVVVTAGTAIVETALGALSPTPFLAGQTHIGKRNKKVFFSFFLERVVDHLQIGWQIAEALLY